MVEKGQIYVHNATGKKYMVTGISFLKLGGVWYEEDPLITYNKDNKYYSRLQSDFILKFTLKD